MAGITITNSGGVIKINNSGSILPIQKTQIITVTVIKSTIIKINVGQGALDNVFVDYTQVTAPVVATPEALRDAITDMLAPAVTGGGGTSDATAANQVTEINILTTLNAAISSLQALSTSIDSKLFFEPLRVDDGGAGLIYKGYGVPGARDEQPVWAIQRIQKVNDVDVYTWANGTRDFNNVWTNRDNANYL